MRQRGRGACRAMLPARPAGMKAGPRHTSGGRIMRGVIMKVLCVIPVVLVCVPPRAAAEDIRVAIADGQTSVEVRSAAGIFTQGSSSTIGRSVTVSEGQAGSAPVRLRSVDGILRVNGRSYRGVIEVRKKQNGRLLVINELDVEDYLLGVVAEEMPHDWPSEALKAQAVVARTFALYQKSEAGRRPYHLRATVRGQVYSGMRGERAAAEQAVQETDGVVIAYQGEAIPAFFHSSCGGHTEDASELWGIDEPYLKGVDCDCQKISKYGQWEKRVTLDAIGSALRREGYRVNGLAAVRPAGLTAAGRVRDVEVVSAAGLERIPADDLRRAVGYSEIPSVFFETDIDGNAVVFSGRGRGHGVGMCQWGAKWMAENGSRYVSILQHYYPGTRLMLIDEIGGS